MGKESAFLIAHLQSTYLKRFVAYVWYLTGLFANGEYVKAVPAQNSLSYISSYSGLKPVYTCPLIISEHVIWLLSFVQATEMAIVAPVMSSLVI